MSRTAHTPCDYEGCDKSPAKDNIALFRVNPKGESGVFMCAEHAQMVNQPPEGAAMSDDERLTPTQELILEVLAARWRLGETLWTFDKRHHKMIRSLAARGFVNEMGGVTENTCRASLTSKGMQRALDPDYVPPRVKEGREKRDTELIRRWNYEDRTCEEIVSLMAMHYGLPPQADLQYLLTYILTQRDSLLSWYSMEVTDFEKIAERYKQEYRALKAQLDETTQV